MRACAVVAGSCGAYEARRVKEMVEGIPLGLLGFHSFAAKPVDASLLEAWSNGPN